MRTEKEMLDIILTYAKEHDEIKIVGMEGSRIHPKIEKDNLQDFDITYIVTNMDTFTQNDRWLDIFGKRIFMQKPEAMTLYEPQLGSWYSYLMLLEDGNRIDLKIVPIEEADLYVYSESLIKILLDKENIIGEIALPTNSSYHVKEPTAQFFDDCCNEFWWVSTFVAKGLCRKEFLYSTDYINQTLRTELYRMISWNVGIDTGFSESVGKSQRFLEKRISKELWNRIVATYNMSSYENLWMVLFSLQEIFREISKEVAQKSGFDYPEYDEVITNYIEELYKKYEK